MLESVRARDIKQWYAKPAFTAKQYMIWKSIEQISEINSGQWIRGPIISPEDGETLEEKFHRLASGWKNDTQHLSSITAMVTHPKYQSIIGMGPAVLPILFKQLQEDPDYWFWALRAITEEDPIPSE